MRGVVIDFFSPQKKIQVLFSTYTYIMYRVPWVFVGATNCVTLNHWQPRNLSLFGVWMDKSPPYTEMVDIIYFPGQSFHFSPQVSKLVAFDVGSKQSAI